MNELKKYADTLLPERSVKIQRIGGGYYADVYRLDFKVSEPLIVKVYKSEQVMEDEISQLAVLKTHSLYPVPDIILSHNKNKKYGKDFIIMNFLEGDNAGKIHYLSSDKRNKLANSIIDNLVALHNVHNPLGFGDINGEKFYETFNDYYKEKVSDILAMASELHRKKELTDYVYDVAKSAAENFDKIFYLPITESSLVHGDYNTWNILANKKQCKVTAIIDPCGCMWADREYDLYQLNNANGKHLKLFETYANKLPLSKNCFEKMAFYELFTEIEHYYKSGYPVIQKLIKKQADNLKCFIDK